MLPILIGASAFAGITFDAGKGVLRVADFAEDGPCTLQMLYEADREHSWGAVSRDPATGAYRINATLVIGENDRGSTHFRIGTKLNPREVLVLNGGLYVVPPFVPKVNDHLKWASALRKQGKVVSYNCLTLGDPADDGVKPALKIATAGAAARNRFCAGVLHPGKQTGYRSRLIILNAVIEPAESGSQGRIDSELHCELKCVNSRIRGFRKSFFYGGRGDWTTVANSVFEGCYVGPINTGQRVLRIQDSVFRNCDRAFGDWGGFMNLELVRCVLEGNERNWVVHRGKARLIDCTIGKPAEENLLYDRFELGKCPEVVVLHRLVAEVTDAAGNAVAGATVMVIPEQMDTSLAPCKQTTDENGRTPGGEADNALLLRECMWKALPGDTQPRRIDYSYEIFVIAPGFAEKSIAGFRARENCQTLRVTLAAGGRK